MCPACETTMCWCTDCGAMCCDHVDPDTCPDPPARTEPTQDTVLEDNVSIYQAIKYGSLAMALRLARR